MRDLMSVVVGKTRNVFRSQDWSVGLGRVILLTHADVTPPPNFLSSIVLPYSFLILPILQ